MKVPEIVLRCYAEPDPDDGTWFAMCIDLNLYSRADSFDEAAKKLKVIIGEYVRDALTVDVEHWSDLIPRRAPLSFVARYHYIRILVHCIGAARWFRSRLFESHLPVVPA